MRWIDGRTEEEKDRIWSAKFHEKTRRTHTWHKWFAWYPVIVGTTDDGARKIKIWLQYVERRKEFISRYSCHEIWKYRQK